MCKQQKLQVLHLSFWSDEQILLFWEVNSLPTDIFCFFVYLTPAESKIQEEQENEHKAWEKRNESL